MSNQSEDIMGGPAGPFSSKSSLMFSNLGDDSPPTAFAGYY
jgi:hypothetical protein